MIQLSIKALPVRSLVTFVIYTFDGNWKLQTENGADGYHVTSVHWNYVATMNHRKQDETVTKVVDPNAWGKSSGGTYLCLNGHIVYGLNYSIQKYVLYMKNSNN